MGFALIAFKLAGGLLEFIELTLLRVTGRTIFHVVCLY